MLLIAAPSLSFMGLHLTVALLALVAYACSLDRVRAWTRTRIFRGALVALLFAGPALPVDASRAWTLAPLDEGDGGLLVLNCPNYPNMSEWERWMCIVSMGQICDCYANLP